MKRIWKVRDSSWHNPMVNIVSDEDVREYYSLGNSYHLSAHPMTCRAIGINPTVMRCHGNGMKVLSRPATMFEVETARGSRMWNGDYERLLQVLQEQPFHAP